jgi:subtilisin family serine protease
VLARGEECPGVAPGCSLIAARIAMGDGFDGWITDDYATADAIDWAWRNDAAVLSNSWGGGAPTDVISRAFARARTQGRGGKGAVVVIAAGNSQSPIGFPADLPGYLTVGASTPKDERKTQTSSDGEAWGSNYGPTLHLLAPGVFIWTTDIHGRAGYDPGDYTSTFNGTSAAAPHVAGTAALMLSVNPGLPASSVRQILGETAKPLAGQEGWTRELGWGRLDAGKAVAAARTTAPKRRPAGAAAGRSKRR